MTRPKNEVDNRNKSASGELVKTLDAAISRLAERNAIEGVSTVFEVIDAAQP
jgi:hypothetical protein